MIASEPPPLEPVEVAAAATAGLERLVALIDQVGDPDLAVPGMGDWVVRDLVTHVSIGPYFYLGGPAGTTRFASAGNEMPEINDENIDWVAGRPLPELRRHLVDGYEALVARVVEEGDDPPRWSSHGGHAMSLLEALALLVGELDVHGFDLAQALGEPWTIPDRDVELAVRGVERILPAWVDAEAAAGHSASYEIRVRGQGVHRWRFTDGRIEVGPDGPWRPDVVVSGAPQPLLLVFYGRVGQYGPMLRGQLLAWGRKPWLGLGLPKLILPA